MKVIFAHSIVKKKKIRLEEKRELLQVYRKSIFVIIKGEELPRHSQLIKIYVTTVSQAKRAVFLADTRSKDGFFLFYRSKNDPIGKNITIKNQKFRQTLHTYLKLLKKDLEIFAYEEYEYKKTI